MTYAVFISYELLYYLIPVMEKKIGIAKLSVKTNIFRALDLSESVKKLFLSFFESICIETFETESTHTELVL